MPSSRARLEALVARLDRRVATLGARSLRLSRLRLAVVLGGGLAAWLVGVWTGAGAGWMVALLTAVTFGVLARVHERIEGARRRTVLWRALQARHLARLALAWRDLMPSDQTPPPDHPFAADLDVVGPRSLLTLLSTAGTRGGHDRLAAWLLDPAPDPDAAQARQARVQALVCRRRLRERLALLAHMAAGTPDARWDDGALRAWIAAAPLSRSLRRWTYVLTALAALTALLFAASVAGAPPFWGFSLTVYLTLYGFRWARMSSVFELSHALQKSLAQAVPLLTFMEGSARQPAPLEGLWQGFKGADRPSQHLRSLRRIAAAAAFTHNEALRLAFNLVVPYDLLLTLALARLRAGLSARIPAWLDAVYELEALGALAAFADLHPQTAVFPDLLDNGCAFEAADLRHPLLHEEMAVGNSIVLACGDVLLLTGSNMSGKSTFLRAVGVASVLAWAGGAVPAAALRLSPLRPFASMRVGDVLQEGLSTFYAEVRRLRRLLDAVEAPGAPALVLIDEMLRGTNNRERLAGSEAIAAALAGARALSLVATHDLALTGLADHTPQVRNAHFREDAVADRLVFDYRLREGPCPTTNALVIMQRAGLPVPAAPPQES